jgi:hypothetical protein
MTVGAVVIPFNGFMDILRHTLAIKEHLAE